MNLSFQNKNQNKGHDFSSHKKGLKSLEKNKRKKEQKKLRREQLLQKRQDLQEKLAKKEPRASSFKESIKNSTGEESSFQKFSTKLRTSPKVPPASIKYLSDKLQLKAPKVYIIKGLWLFTVFLFIRLIFAGGGVIEYYEKSEQLKSLQYEYSLIGTDNNDLNSEIEMINTNVRYQKKLVRDFLGFIAKDEYLILFPGESS